MLGSFGIEGKKLDAAARRHLANLALARIPVRAELDTSRVRGGDPTRIALDATRFRQKTGWSPRIALADSLRDTLDHWRAIVAGGSSLTPTHERAGTRGAGTGVE